SSLQRLVAVDAIDVSGVGNFNFRTDFDGILGGDWMNQFLTLLLCTVFCLSAESKKLADLRHALLFKVQNMNQFRQLKNEISEIEKQQKNCQRQWQTSEFPSACYWFYNRKIESSELPFSILNQNELDQKCFAWVEKNYAINYLNQLNKRYETSQACQSYIQQQIKKLNYIRKWQGNCLLCRHEKRMDIFS
ncbi:MAG: hypothetical protein KDD40_03840, partial [Bdellovibrionales bacterium]|nr:hypothetical protein [Bdellovibrionales bacterium]